MKKEITVPVIGMHCASCANIVSKSLKKIPGVGEASASYATEKATISYDPDIATETSMRNEVIKYGYDLAFPTVEHHYQIHHDHMGNIDSPKSVWFTFIAALVMFGVMMWETFSVMFPRIIPKFPLPMQVWGGIQFFIATIVLFVFGTQFLRSVMRFIRYGVANMDTLVGIGTLTAYIYSTFVYFFPSITMKFGLPETKYYDVTIVVIGFILYGKYLEARSKRKTGEALEKLMGLQVKTAVVRTQKGDQEVSIDQVNVGDLIVVKPGTKIPVDGKITEGASTIDESMITGESLPIDANIGQSVVGGTMNITGAIIIKATKIGSDTVLAHITHMVEAAQSSKAPIEGLADKISGIFVPTVLVISFLTFILWLFLGNIINFPGNIFAFALTSAIGVLVIACPCALGLATPTAIITGVGRGARMGILIKNAESLEKLERINTVVVDKTGTLTEGKPRVVGIKPQSVKASDPNREDLLQILASLEQYSEHPIASAILKKNHEEQLEILPVTNFKASAGFGVSGNIQGKTYAAGNASYMGALGVMIQNRENDSPGTTPIFITEDKKILGIIYISDVLKSNAAETITSLQKIGIKVVMLSGDLSETANIIGKQAGISNVIGGVKPDEKAGEITKLQLQGHKVAMVGDGINDAPALATADVGIAMSTGTDIAMSTADVTLLHGDISKVLAAFRLSRATMKIVRQNLFWAFIYNVIGIPIAAGLLYPFLGIVLNPLVAGIAMAGSSVTVVTNSLRLRNMKI